MSTRHLVTIKVLAELTAEELTGYIKGMRAAGYVPSQFGTPETLDGNANLRRACEEQERRLGWRQILVGFDDRPFAVAYDDRTTWNGWKKPLFARDEALKACAAFNDLRAQYQADGLPEAAEIVTATVDGDTIIIDDPLGEPVRLEPHHVAGIPEPVYDFALGMTWVEWNTDEVDASYYPITETEE